MSKNLKIDENSYCGRKKYLYLLNDLSNFNEIFLKDVTYDNIKSRKKTGFILSLEDTF